MKAKDFRWGVDKLSAIEPDPSSYHFPEYDPHMQLIGLNQMVSVLLQQSSANATDIQVGIHTGGYKGERAEDAYVDDCSSAAYFDAFVSSSIAAALAQFLESLIKNEVRSIQVNKKNSAKNITHVRSEKMSNRAGFWSFDKYWSEIEDDKGKHIGGSIVLGTIQLFDALDLRSKLPANFDAFITMLFQYRNSVMHNGVEWEVKQRDKFKKTIAENKCDGFYWSTSAGKDNICYLKDEYVKELLKFCNEFYNVFHPDLNA
jgi:hypothetical protein